MSKGWRASALTLIFCVVSAFAGEPVPAPEAAPSAQPTACQEGGFSAERLSQAIDREEQKRSGQTVETAAVVSPTESSGLVSLLSKMFFSLFIVVGLIYAVSYAARRWSGSVLLPSTGPLKILARQSLSAKSSVYVVAALDRLLIIGESPQGLTCLSQFDDPEENRKLRETWGWEGAGTKERNRLYSPKTSPFGPSLRSHVEDLERELSRLQEVS